MEFGAGDGIRTRDIDLGKVALYQLSYSRPERLQLEVSAVFHIVAPRSPKVKSSNRGILIRKQQATGGPVFLSQTEAD